MIELKPDNGWIAFDSKGIRYPWYSSGALEVLDKMDLTGKYIFEWGVGYSTEWYRSRGMKTWGVDSNKEWVDKIITQFEPDKEKYINFPKKWYTFGFDIMAIDGIHRDECTPIAVELIRKGGLIIIDNWMQPSVEPNSWFRTLDVLAAKKLPHTVYRQDNHLDWSTLIIQC